MSIHKTISEVTERITSRSASSRKAYLEQVQKNFKQDTGRRGLSCGNLAHGFAGCSSDEKAVIAAGEEPNMAIITAYNDMLSAHKPYETYPDEFRTYAKEFNATVQVAGATPAMCDGVTQGMEGMDLSLLSRDVIALSTAIGLSHSMFDGVFNLGICDKIVPGLMIGNLSFGHYPVVFVPAGPMPSGISNDEKARIRQEFAEGKIGREELLKGEADSYHSPGTCTFYGTANSNQMLMEIMGMQLPGSSFVNPGTKMRAALNHAAVKILVENIRSKDISRSIGHIIDEKAIVNGIIGLLATGGSTNHTLHMIAIAKAAGIHITWDDFSALSEVIPLVCRVYPNGAADINHFHASGGMAFVIKTLLKNGLLHEDVNTILGKGLLKYTKEPKLINRVIVYEAGPEVSLNESIIRSAENPFQKTGGLKVLKGNIGVSVIKTSAVDPSHHALEAPAIVFDDQDDLIAAFKRGELEKDFIAVIPFQGPKQKGMPELHKLTPSLTILQKRGFKVGLVTDGRMSGASGKVPAAIHISPEAANGGAIGKIQTGDLISLDAKNGVLECKTPGFMNREERSVVYHDDSHGRQLFKNLRGLISSSEEGAGIL
ncbi:phosphogluconate dehydratase [Fluviicola sp.]|uniref:phosphogluconate dehydratase n=1 Tax=Fluviicola sp. TaxID=1917219 RepID=UPI003D2E993B